MNKLIKPLFITKEGNTMISCLACCIPEEVRSKFEFWQGCHVPGKDNEILMNLILAWVIDGCWLTVKWREQLVMDQHNQVRWEE